MALIPPCCGNKTAFFWGGNPSSHPFHVVPKKVNFTSIFRGWSFLFDHKLISGFYSPGHSDWFRSVYIT